MRLVKSLLRKWIYYPDKGGLIVIPLWMAFSMAVWFNTGSMWAVLFWLPGIILAVLVTGLAAAPFIFALVYGIAYAAKGIGWVCEMVENWAMSEEG